MGFPIDSLRLTAKQNGSRTSGMPHFGTFHGRNAIEKGYAQFFQSWPFHGGDAGSNPVRVAERVNAALTSFSKGSTACRFQPNE
jgi:hypothetical protein